MAPAFGWHGPEAQRFYRTPGCTQCIGSDFRITIASARGACPMTSLWPQRRLLALWGLRMRWAVGAFRTDETSQYRLPLHCK